MCSGIAFIIDLYYIIFYYKASCIIKYKSGRAIWLTVRYSGKLAEQKSAWYHREIPKNWYGSKRYRQVLNRVRRVRRAREKQELRRIAQGDREPSFPLWRRDMARIRVDEW
jgi:hypothetical protein